jgi:molybdate transport system substrate-binding protein
MRILKLLLLPLLLISAIQAASITVATAASYRNAMEEIVTLYDQPVELIFNASGKIYHQVTQGAPFDLFMAADMRYPQEVVKGGFALGEAIPTVENRLALYSSKHDVSAGLDALLGDDVHKIAIANPRVAPVGKRSVEALQNGGVYEAIESKLVYGESISQATHFIEMGGAQMGITALSLIADRLEGANYHLISRDLHQPMTYGSVVLKNSQNPEAVKRFLAFLKTPEIVAVFEKHGLIALP